jgi:drug/metabolite transporter (DMT)-like permease
VIFGLGSAAAFGAGDFSGGLAARRAPAWIVAAGAQVVGLSLLLLLAALTRPPAPEAETLLYGIAAGVFGGLGLAALYAALSLGSMGLVAALSGVGSVAIPAVVGALLFAQHLSTGQWMGVTAAAAVGFGVWFVLLDLAADRQALWALVASRASASALIGGLAVGLARRDLGRVRAAWPLIGLAGALDVTGNAAFVVASTLVPVGLAAALSGLYPVVTMLLSWVLLRDRLPPLGLAALILAVGGTVLISTS